MYVLYSALLPSPSWSARRGSSTRRCSRRKYIGSLRERFGRLPLSFNLDGEPSLWVHAVSVGEVLAARPIAEELKTRFPGFRLLVSTTTAAGQQLAKRQLPERGRRLLLPDRLRVGRAARARPCEAPAAGADGRRDLAEYPARMPAPRRQDRDRERPRLDPVVRRATACFGRCSAACWRDVDAFCMQSDESARRMIALGADPSRVTVTGSLKFDAARLPASPAQGRPRERVLRYFRVPHDRIVVVAGSTMRGEELPVLRAFRRDQTRLAARAAGHRAAPRRSVHEVDAHRARRRLRHGAPHGAGRRRRSARRRRRARHDRRAGARSTRSRRWPSLAEAWSRPAGTTSSSRRCTGGRLSSGRRCPTSPRSPTCSSPSDAAVQVANRRGARGGADLARRAIRCAGPRSARRRARWSTRTAAPRRRTLEVIARLLPRSGRSCDPSAGPLTHLVLTIASHLYALGTRVRRRSRCRRPDARAASTRPVVSVGNLASAARGKTPLVGVHRATARRRGRAARHPEPRVRPRTRAGGWRHRRQRRRSGFAPTSSARATSR